MIHVRVLWPIAVAAFSTAAYGQCVLGWKPCPPGAWPTDEIFALATWDPDALGPQQPVVVAGGNFFVPSIGVALWNGSNWLPMTTGVAGGNVRAACVYDPDGAGAMVPMPVIGGAFTSVGGTPANRVAWWDGSAWRPFGSGIGSQDVSDLAVYQGDLVAGGVFFTAGGNPTTGLARWDGAAWHDMSYLGVTSPLALLAADGDLYASAHIGGGQFGVRRLRNGAWETLGPSNSPNGAFALGFFQNQLIAGGSFWVNPTNHNIARFDGATWQPMGEFEGPVISLTSWDPGGAGPMPERLIAGGGFITINGAPVSHIASWNGTQWSPLGSGMDAGPWDFAEWNGDLVMGGNFSTAGGIVSPNFARYGCPDPPCFPDCNGDGLLTLSDFGCFQTRFAVGNMLADCNRDSLLQLSDFGCFITKYALGCP